MRNKAPTMNNTKSGKQMEVDSPRLRPGDKAPRGTLGTGEDICPDCHGKGRIDGSPCPNCGGTGKITRGIGGA